LNENIDISSSDKSSDAQFSNMEESDVISNPTVNCDNDMKKYCGFTQSLITQQIRWNLHFTSENISLIETPCRHYYQIGI